MSVTFNYKGTEFESVQGKEFTKFTQYHLYVISGSAFHSAITSGSLQNPAIIA